MRWQRSRAVRDPRRPDLTSHILQEPLWLQIWLVWLLLVNSASVAFVRRGEARWVLIAFVANLVTLSALFELNGYNRLLGLSHVIWWTPLLVYLYRRPVLSARPGAFPAWLRVLFVTNLASLVVDYVDVARYALGDRT